MTLSAKTKISSNFSFQDNKKDKHKRIKLFGKISLFIVIFMLGLQIATQYAAHKFSYSESLGEPIYRLRDGTYPLYPFWKAISWFFQLREYYGVHKEVTHVFGMTGYIISLSMLIGAVGTRVVFLKAGMSAHESLHGSAHWADRDEIIQAGLLDKDGNENKTGVVVGGWNDGNAVKILRSDGQEHTLVFAPTRSGKGVGLVLPTLLGEWTESVFVLDVKAENYNLTAGYRKKLGHEIFKFNPADPTASTKGTSVTFNPLEEIPLDYEVKNGKYSRVIRGEKDGETAIVQRIADIIVDPEGKGLTEHWTRTSHALLVGAITHLLYYGRNNGFCPSLADISQELSQPGGDWKDGIRKWQTYPHLGFDENKNPIPHPVALYASQEAIQRDPKEGSSVLSTALSFLSLYRDPIIADNTRVSSFKIRDLMNREKPVALYFVVKPTDLSRLQPFIRIFITLMVNSLADEQAYSDGRAKMLHKHRLLLMLDEFPSLGKLPIFERALAFIGSFGLKAYIIVQDLTQLYAAYSDRESIVGNCDIQIAFAPGNVATAKLLSEKSGTTTVIKEAVSESGKRTDVFHNNTSVSIQEVSRPLLTVDECMRLPGARKDLSGSITEAGAMLIFKRGFSPVYGTQTLYFMDEELNKRAKMPPPEVSDHTIKMKEEQLRIEGIKNKLKTEAQELKKTMKELEQGYNEAQAEGDDEKMKGMIAKAEDIRNYKELYLRLRGENSGEQQNETDGGTRESSKTPEA